MLWLLLPLLAHADTDDLMTWLHRRQADSWAAQLQADLADPGKAELLALQLADESRWRDHVAHTRHPVLQLIDVLPADTGWQSRPLTQADADALEAYLHQLLGVRFTIQLTTESVVYREAFADKFRAIPQGQVVTTSSYTSPSADPDLPILYTFGVLADETGQRVVASASGGVPDQRAMVGSAARPIAPGNRHLYAHELLHALGIRHHLRSDVYADPSNHDLAVEAVIGSDCIMTASYVGGVWDGDPAATTSADGYRKMLEAVCPLCRYLLSPRGRGTRRYLRWYMKNALWLEEGDQGL